MVGAVINRATQLVRFAIEATVGDGNAGQKVSRNHCPDSEDYNTFKIQAVGPDHPYQLAGGQEYKLRWANAYFLFCISAIYRPLT